MLLCPSTTRAILCVCMSTRVRCVSVHVCVLCTCAPVCMCTNVQVHVRYCPCSDEASLSEGNQGQLEAAEPASGVRWSRRRGLGRMFHTVRLPDSRLLSLFQSQVDMCWGVGRPAWGTKAADNALSGPSVDGVITLTHRPGSKAHKELDCASANNMQLIYA